MFAFVLLCPNYNAGWSLRQPLLHMQIETWIAGFGILHDECNQDAVGFERSIDFLHDLPGRSF